MEVALQLSENAQKGKIKRKITSLDGRVVGTYHEKPMLSTMAHEVEFPDFQFRDFSASILAKSMPTRADEDDLHAALFDPIVGFKRK